jgi:hypothetical protein
MDIGQGESFEWVPPFQRLSFFGPAGGEGRGNRSRLSASHFYYQNS